MSTYACELFLLDRAVQGKGNMIDLAVAREITARFPCFVAGELTAENVADIVAFTHPYGVDVAGGIETDHYPNSQKIRRFAENALLAN